MTPAEYSRIVHDIAGEVKTLVHLRVVEKLKPTERVIILGRVWNLLFNDHFQILMETAAESEAATLAAQALAEGQDQPATQPETIQAVPAQPE